MIWGLGNYVKVYVRLVWHRTRKFNLYSVRSIFAHYTFWVVGDCISNTRKVLRSFMA